MCSANTIIIIIIALIEDESVKKLWDLTVQCVDYRYSGTRGRKCNCENKYEKKQDQHLRHEIAAPTANIGAE